MYLSIGSILAHFITIGVVLGTILLYLWYFTYDESKKLPLLFQVMFLGVFCTTQHEVHQYIKENPVPTKESDWRVNNFCILLLLGSIVLYVMTYYAWIIVLPGLYYILKEHFAETTKIIKSFREDESEYDI